MYCIMEITFQTGKIKKQKSQNVNEMLVICVCNKVLEDCYFQYMVQLSGSLHKYLSQKIILDKFN